MNPAEESRKRRNYDAFRLSTNRSISPPPKRHTSTVSARLGEEQSGKPSVVNVALSSNSSSSNGDNPSTSTQEVPNPRARDVFQSPMQLNFIEELPASSNVDCVSLGSILGDPMIKECWLFNYLFDMDFVM